VSGSRRRTSDFVESFLRFVRLPSTHSFLPILSRPPIGFLRCRSGSCGIPGFAHSSSVSFATRNRHYSSRRRSFPSASLCVPPIVLVNPTQVRTLLSFCLLRTLLRSVQLAAFASVKLRTVISFLPLFLPLIVSASLERERSILLRSLRPVEMQYSFSSIPPHPFLPPFFSLDISCETPRLCAFLYCGNDRPYLKHT